MPDIVLTTLNAKYIHVGVGLRYLLANLGPQREKACIAEFDIHQHPLEIVERIQAFHPRIVGLGVYIWNASVATEVAALLKRVCPEVILVLGGPEISFETEQQALFELADYIVLGEGETTFAELCREILGGSRPECKVLQSALPDLERLTLPYPLYTDDDIAHRVLYVEASRGCAFGCEFCLSALDNRVRQFPLESLLKELDALIGRGARQFKFVDRTFNLHLKTAIAILEFFLARQKPGLFIHFEMVPDRLPGELRELIAQYPPGGLQFEIGIQTFNTEVAENINRRQDYAKLEENIRFLREKTGVHVHADLIVGLPGETVESFGRGFDRLIALRPQEIQVGILKRLRGAPIARHDARMVYSAHPPYEILRNDLIDFPTMQRLRRFARFWDLIGNSGNFVETAPLLWGKESPFEAFLKLSDWLYEQIGRQHSIALANLAELLFIYLTKEANLPAAQIAPLAWRDWQRSGRCEKPTFLKDYVSDDEVMQARTRHFAAKRQAKHL